MLLCFPIFAQKQGKNGAPVFVVLPALSNGQLCSVLQLS
jgi:hypothetical protein